MCCIDFRNREIFAYSIIFAKTSRGGECVFHLGHKFIKDKVFKKTVRWRCHKYQHKCRANLITNDKKQLESFAETHNHESDNKNIFKMMLDNRLESNCFAKPQQLINHIHTNFDVETPMPTDQSMRRHITYTKRKLYPKEPAITDYYVLAVYNFLLLYT